MADQIVKLPNAATLLSRAHLKERVEAVVNTIAERLRLAGEIENVDIETDIAMNSPTSGSLRVTSQGRRDLLEFIDEEIEA